jgi:hypothetical protein
MTPERETLPPLARRVAWGLFAAQVLLVLGWAVHVDRASPPPVASGATSADGVRFGLPEARRRLIFQELLRGEPQDRLDAQKISELATWNRNHDDHFHEREWRRVGAVASANRIPFWQAYLIMDEGFRAHWPPPAGVEIRHDDAPLKRTTVPFHQRPLLLP